MKNLVAVTIITAVLATSVSLADYSAPLEDTYKTMAMWNMNNLTTLSDGKVINLDQDTNFPRSNRHLEFFDGTNTSTDRGGTIVPSMSGFGNAASFDGVNDWARTSSTIPVENDFKLELWFRADKEQDGINWIAEVPGVWRLFTDSNATRLRFQVNNADGNWVPTLVVPIYDDYRWQHVTVRYEDGVAYDLNFVGTNKKQL